MLCQKEVSSAFKHILLPDTICTNRIPYLWNNPVIPIFEYTSNGHQSVLKRYLCCVLLTKMWKEPKMSINRWMDNENDTPPPSHILDEILFIFVVCFFSCINGFWLSQMIFKYFTHFVKPYLSWEAKFFNCMKGRIVFWNMS